MSYLLRRPRLAPGEPVHTITPDDAGWSHVGFEVVDLAAGESLTRIGHGRELCVVMLSGTALGRVGGEDFGSIGGRLSPFSGNPTSLICLHRSGSS